MRQIKNTNLSILSCSSSSPVSIQTLPALCSTASSMLPEEQVRRGVKGRVVENPGNWIKVFPQWLCRLLWQSCSNLAFFAKNIYELANDIVLPPVDQYWDLLEFAAKDGMRA
jgi:hypothetical protein